MSADALEALKQWFRDAPGGQWLPDDFMEREPCTLVTVTGEFDSDRYFCQLFVKAYQPDAEDEDEGERVYTVPLIVAQALVWYGGNDDWWAEYHEPPLDEPADPLAPPAEFEMYSPEADAAVHAFLIEAKRIAETDPEVRNRQTLVDKLRPLHKALGQAHPELGDTEPRNHIADYLDLLCEAHGWSYDRGEGYDW